MSSLRFNHHIHIFSRAKSRTQSNSKGRHPPMGSQILLCKNSIDHHIRFQSTDTLSPGIYHHRNLPSVKN